MSFCKNKKNFEKGERERERERERDREREREREREEREREREKQYDGSAHRKTILFLQLTAV